MYGRLVKNVMTGDVLTVRTGSKLWDAAVEMRARRISGVPVVDEDGRMVGVLSEKDIVRDLHRAAGVGSARGLLDVVLALAGPGREAEERARACRGRLQRATVGEVMTRDPVTVDPEDSLSKAARTMDSHHVNRLPVVAGGKLVGIVTRQDVIWWFRRARTRK